MLSHIQDRAAANGPGLRGIRFQLFMALRSLAAGEPMLAYVDGAHESRGMPVPMHVAGTLAKDTIGHLLLDRGWCSQSSAPHWIPSVRIFELNATGRESLAQARLWWRELTWWQRLHAMIFE